MVLGYLKWFINLLNGKIAPQQVARAFLIGMLFGMVPFGIWHIVGLVLLLVIQCHFATGLLAMGLAALLQLAIGDAVYYPLGEAIIEGGPHGLFTSLATSDQLSILGLHRSAVVGSLVAGALLGVSCYLVLLKILRAYYARYRDGLRGRRWFKNLRRFFLFDWLFGLIFGW